MVVPASDDAEAGTMAEAAMTEALGEIRGRVERITGLLVVNVAARRAYFEQPADAENEYAEDHSPSLVHEE